VKRLNYKDNIFIINDLDIREFTALCKSTKLFVSNSTGPIHIAAAVGTFCVGFYSPVRQESAVRWAPYTDKKKIFTPDLEEGESLHNIMDKIKPEDVKSFILDYLNKN
jgi:heptosyltransferase-3